MCIAVKEMQKSVNCLALELPEAVHEDVKKRWKKILEYIETLENKKRKVTTNTKTETVKIVSPTGKIKIN